MFTFKIQPMNIRYLLYGILLLGLVYACENDDYVWGEENFARINAPEIWTNGTDSMTFTFSTMPTDSITFQLETEVVIQGQIANFDRVVHLQINKDKTTAPENIYSFPKEVTLPAGEHKTVFPIILHRTTAMQTKDMRLCIEIAPTGDLQGGVNNASSLTITWNDKITKPNNWEDLEEFFGSYSETKYRFIISTLGIYEFPYGSSSEFTWGLMFHYKVKMKTALENYNNDSSNPNRPMKDENGGTVSFPI